MANPTTIDGAEPALIETSATEQSLTLEGGRSYAIAHLGLDAANVVDNGLVFFSIRSPVGVDLTPRADKGVLRNLMSCSIGPGAGELRFRAATGAPILMVVPERRVGAES